MRARMNAAARMALQYVLLFGATGVSLPFAGLWFRAQGLSGAEIGALLAAPMLGRVVTGPLLALVCALWTAGGRFGAAAGWLAVTGGLIFALALSSIGLFGLAVMGAVAPVGGVLMIAAWLLAAGAAFRTLPVEPRRETD